MAMVIEEFSARIIALGKDIDSLCDDLYSATQDEVDENTMNMLITKGKEKIAFYEKLLDDTTGGMNEEVEGYGSFIQEIKDFIDELKNK